MKVNQYKTRHYRSQGGGGYIVHYSRTSTTLANLFWDILDELIDEREKEMSELVNLINVSKATNSKIKFPYWKLPITSDKSVHPSPYESYLQDTYNNFCHDLDGKPHTTTLKEHSHPPK